MGLTQAVRRINKSVTSKEDKTLRRGPLSSVTDRVMVRRGLQEGDEVSLPPLSGQVHGRRPRVWSELRGKTDILREWLNSGSRDSGSYSEIVSVDYGDDRGT